MRQFTFPYYVSFGNGDSVDCEIDVKLTNKDALRLEQSARAESRFRLYEDVELKDIYDKVFSAVIRQEIRNLKSMPEMVEEILEEYQDDEEISKDEALKMYMDELDIGINYPNELQS